MTDPQSAHDPYAPLRQRPAVDLIMRMPAIQGARIIDLGCGVGIRAPLMRLRFKEARITGVAPSAADLQAAWQTGLYDALEERRIEAWTAREPVDLILCPEALGNIAQPARILPALVGSLRPGGTLAVQIPHQSHAPSHRLWFDLIEQHAPQAFDPSLVPDLPEAVNLFDLLDPLGKVTIWETEYWHQLHEEPGGHAVRLFTQPEVAQPMLARLTPDQRAEITAAYDQAVAIAYPRRADGSVLLPIKRLFLTVKRSDPA